MPQRTKTNYPGVYYRMAKGITRRGQERVYYIVFKRDGRTCEEKVGRQYADAMTAAKASHIRGERVEGKRKSRREIRDAQEAERKALRNRWTIERLWDEYKSNRPDLKGILHDKGRFKNYLQPNFGQKAPEELLQSEVDKFRLELLKTKKPATVRNILELLRRIIMFGAKKQHCKGLDFTIEMPTVNNEITEVLSREELSRLYQVLEESPYAQAANMMKMALFTGMRRGELFRLKWKDIDFENKIIHIRDPKGGKDQKIPLPSAVQDILESHPRTESPFVFPGRKGQQRADISKYVNLIKEQAGLPKAFRPLHGLRHVYASTSISSGKVGLYTLQKLLTHKSPAMTQRYAHLQNDTLRQGAEVVSDSILNQVDTSNRKEE